MASHPTIPKNRIVGDLEAVSLFDLCQFFLICRRTGALRLESGGRRATITIIEGQVVGAVDDALKEGESAFQRLLAWRTGTFEFAPGPVSAGSPSRITTPTDALLLDAARHFDETSEALGVPDPSAPAGHTAAFLEKQRFAREVADLFSSLEDEETGEIDFRKDVPLETLLAAAARRGARRIFLRAGETPKASGPRGLAPLARTPITRRVIDRMLGAFLGGGDKLALLEMESRVARERLLEGIGYVRVEIALDEDLRRVTITLLEPEAPPPAAFGLDEGVALPLLGAPRGLLLIASPPRSGKSTLAATLAAAVSRGHGRHVVFYEECRRFRLREENGVLEHLDLPPAHDGGETIAEQVWRRKADVVVIDAVRSGTHAEAAIEAASGGGLVLAAVEAPGAVDAVPRFLALLGGTAERNAERFADVLLGVIAVRPRRGGAHGELESHQAPTGDLRRWDCELLPRIDGLTRALLAGDRVALSANLVQANPPAPRPA